MREQEPAQRRQVWACPHAIRRPAGRHPAVDQTSREFNLLTAQVFAGSFAGERVLLAGRHVTAMTISATGKEGFSRRGAVLPVGEQLRPQHRPPRRLRGNAIDVEKVVNERLEHGDLPYGQTGYGSESPSRCLGLLPVWPRRAGASLQDLAAPRLNLD